MKTMEILNDIEAFLKEVGWSGATLGLYAVNNAHVVDRLRKGRTITLVTADRLNAYMAAERERRKETA